MKMTYEERGTQLAHLAAGGHIQEWQTLFREYSEDPDTVLCFVNLIRSGKTKRRSFGTTIKRELQHWLISQSATDLDNIESRYYHGVTVGDLIKMLHPRPRSEEQSKMFAHFLGHQ